MTYYIVVVSDPDLVRYVIRVLKRHGVYVAAVAFLVDLDPKEAAGILGGIRRLDRKRVSAVRGYLPLPVQR